MEKKRLILKARFDSESEAVMVNKKWSKMLVRLYFVGTSFFFLCFRLTELMRTIFIKNFLDN